MVYRGRALLPRGLKTSTGKSSSGKASTQNLKWEDLFQKETFLLYANNYAPLSIHIFCLELVSEEREAVSVKSAS